MSAVYTVHAFSASNLFNAGGGLAINVADNNGVLLGNPPFLHAGGPVQRIRIREEDTDRPPGNSAGYFDDGTDARQFLDAPVTLGFRDASGREATHTFPAGSVVQSEFIIAFSSGYRLTGLRLTDPATGRLFTAGYALVRPDGRLVTEAGRLDLGRPQRNATDGTQPWSAIACFAPRTLIRVPGGRMAAADLRPGDLVETLDAGPMPVEWSGRFVVPAGRADPVAIPPGCLGARRLLLLSPQHRVLLRHPSAEMLAGSAEGLAAAVHLSGLGGVARRAAAAPVHYVHFRLPAHALVEAEGVWCETLWGGADLRLDLGAPLGSDPLPPLRPEPLVRPLLHRAEAALVFRAILRDAAPSGDASAA